MLLLTLILSLRMVTKCIMPPFLLSKILMHNVEQGAMTVTFTHLGMHFSYYYDLLPKKKPQHNTRYNFLYYIFFQKLKLLVGELRLFQ